MSLLATVSIVLFAIHMTLILCCTLGILYTLVTYRESILYERGVRLFAWTIVVVSTATVLNFANTVGALGRVWVPISDGLYVVGVGLLIIATWQFSREFIETTPRERDISTESGDAEGGFEDA